MTAQYDKLVTVKQLVVLLRQSYDDPDKQGTAQRLIGGLEMKNRTFMDYLSEFRQHIDATGYDTVTWKFNLENGLSNELNVLLVHVDFSSLTYDQLVTKCQQLDSRYRAAVQHAPKTRIVLQLRSLSYTLIDEAYLESHACVDVWLKHAYSRGTCFFNPQSLSVRVS